MRLAIVAPHFPEYAIRYASAMSRYCDVLVCVDEHQFAEEFADRSVSESCRSHCELVRFKTPHDLWRISRLVKQFGPDVVHFQEAAGPRRAFFNLSLARQFKRRALVALTVHDPVPHGGRDEAAAKRTAWVGSFVRGLADIIVVHGAFCARLAETHLQARNRNVLVSEHGCILEPSVFQPAPAAPIRLYCFGRMEAYKGIEVLLQAVEILHADGFPFALEIAGNGPELERLQARFACLPEVDMHFGYVAPNAIMQSIQAAECVVLPYLSATQSGVLAAAFAGHRYVIASNVGGLPDVVTHGENGLLVPPGDPGALADAVRMVADDPLLRARLLAGAEATARTRLDWDRIAKSVFAAMNSKAPTRRNVFVA